MSNPLLQPDDPRFRRPDVRDAGGRNPFADDDAPVGESAGQDPYTAGAEARPYQPEFVAQQRPRTKLLHWLAVGGWFAAGAGSVALTGIAETGWIWPLFGLGPAAAAWLLGRQDLQAIAVGALDPAARPATRRASWSGLAAVILCLAVLAAMLFRQLAFLPEL